MTVALREHILCVDDEEGVLSALRQQLGTRFGAECDIDVARSGRDALALVEELARAGEPLAVVIADQIMPGMKGVELLEEVHRRSPATGKILLTGQAGLDAVVTAINRAALDRYLPKPWDGPDLRLAVENLLRQFRLARENEALVGALAARNAELEGLAVALEAKVAGRTRELAEANARLAQLAISDGLTGLYNHRHFHERLALDVERSARRGVPISLLRLDLDGFKDLNERFGHAAGDEALRRVARACTEGRRDADFAARYAGEEFAIVLAETRKLDAARMAEALRERIAAARLVDAGGAPAGAHTTMTASIGVATFPDDAAGAEDLVRRADRALARAKESGRNRVVLSG